MTKKGMSTTIKAVIRKGRINKEGTTPIYIRLTHNRDQHYFKTDYRVQPDQFNNTLGIVRKNHPLSKKINLQLQERILQMQRILDYFGMNIKDLELDTILQRLTLAEGSHVDFIKYLNGKINKYEDHGKKTLAESYRSTLNHIKKYLGEEITLYFDKINRDWLESFESYLKDEGLSINSIAVYMRNIRATFNNAIDDGLVRQDIYPFRKYKIKKEDTQKRAITLKEIRKIYKAKMENEKEEQARDIFILIFFLIGINIKDLLYLNKKDLKKGRIIYHRAKTGRLYNIKVEPEAREILKKYKGKKYLLNFLEEKETGPRKSDPYRDLNKQVNKYLKRIATREKIKAQVTTYTARHSWATIAASLGVPRDIIAHALGHGLNTVTDIYIDYSQEDVDQANRKIIDLII